LILSGKGEKSRTGKRENSSLSLQIIIHVIAEPSTFYEIYTSMTSIIIALEILKV
jgi:hypothetical protein